MFARLVFLLAAMAVAGCDLPQYGASITYNERNPNPIVVTMPPGAPSITQQFRPSRDGAGNLNETDAHLGLDVWARPGTPVLAAAPGRIIQSYFDPAYGNTLVVDHGPDETGARVVTRYIHLRRRITPRGATVARGDQIAELGATGFLSGGFPHLHFEVVRNVGPRQTRAFDPHLFWAGGPGRVVCFDPDIPVPAPPFRTTYPVACRGEAE